MTFMIDLTLHSLVSKSFTVNTVEMLKHSVSKVSKEKEPIKNVATTVRKSINSKVVFD